jgi:pentatricopeptide repeat protein
MISRYVLIEKHHKAWDIFCMMHHEGMAPGQPNLVSVLSTISHLEFFDILASLHAYSLKTAFGRDVVVGTAMLNAYTRNTSMLDIAIKFFDCMT